MRPVSRGVRAAISAALVLVVVVGWVLAAGSLLVRQRFLEPSWYTGALAEANAYDRVYTEVLADPELALLVEDLVGGAPLRVADPAQVRQATTAALRHVVPPATLQNGTEAVINETMAYLRREDSALDGGVDVSGVVTRVQESAGLTARTRLALLPERVVTTLEEFRVSARQFIDDVIAERVPPWIPVLVSTTATTVQVTQTVFGVLGRELPEQDRAIITALVSAGDRKSAMLETAASVVEEAAARAEAELAAAAQQGRVLAVVDEVAERAQVRADRVVGQLDDVRTAADWLRPAVGIAGLCASIAALVALGWLHRRTPTRAAVLVGGAIATAGVVMAVGWWFAARLAGPPLEAATGTGEGSWGLPAGVRSVLTDVVDLLASSLRATVARLALVPIAIGIIVILVALALPRVRDRRWAVAIPLSGGVLAVGVVTFAVLNPGDTDEDPSADACNGYEELCDRRYDEVVYGATHNSMSSPDVVQVWPEHDGDLRSQLEQGVRALLIDTHYWTSLVDAEQMLSEQDLITRELAERLIHDVDPSRDPKPGEFLCHNHCAWGGKPLLDGLRDVRAFLDSNPREVVTLIIQDAIDVAATEAAFRIAGLDTFLHTQPLGEQWPTLGQMIARGTRLVVFSERSAAPPAWNHNAFDFMQETPFLARSPEEFSCAPNRGPAGASLFLMNHWVSRTVPDRVDSSVVNTREFLVRRARQCAVERGLLPNFLAVNFSEIGDLRGAVAELNGVG